MRLVLGCCFMAWAVAALRGVANACINAISASMSHGGGGFFGLH